MSAVTFGTLAELVRLPAVLSVPGDAWAGAAASGWTRGAAMPLASAMIYLGGMALNDWADRKIDAVERPERPIPSGRIAPSMALAVGAGLIAGGVGVAGALGGKPALRVAVPLAGTVYLYDAVVKDKAIGPFAMAACRSLDVMLGAAGGDVRKALPAAAVVGTHTAAVTNLSRHEVHGAPASVPKAAAATAIVAGLASSALSRRSPAMQRAATRIAATTYIGLVGGAFAKAAQRPEDPAAIRQAVGKGVMGIIPLQASLLTGRGAWLRAAATAAAIPVGRALARKRAVT